MRRTNFSPHAAHAIESQGKPISVVVPSSSVEFQSPGSTRVSLFIAQTRATDPKGGKEVLGVKRLCSLFLVFQYDISIACQPGSHEFL